MSSEEKHNLKSYFWKVQMLYYVLTVGSILGGMVFWFGSELKEIHYAAKTTPVLERHILKTDSSVLELYKYLFVKK